MNKDFLKKPISLKDIKIEKINLKNIKNKKEIVIGILVLGYIIGILIFGSNLLKVRAEVKSQYEIKEQKYEALQRAKSEDQIKKQIQEIELEKGKLVSKVEGIKSNSEFTEILSEFRANSPIAWEQAKQEISVKLETKEFEDYDIYSVKVGSFSGTFSQVQEFLEYVNNYDKIVRIDSLSFRKNQITGTLGGDFRISFYFKKAIE